MSCGINFMTSGFLQALKPQSLTINIFVFDQFRPFVGKIALSSKSTGERSHLVHFGHYCHYVIKYLMRDMMDYHCREYLEVAIEG